MDKQDIRYQTYLQILRLELIPAMGCTEPTAIAYCAAKAREVLGRLPDRVLVHASGSIIKNVKSVVVPNTGGRKGIEAAAGIGIIAGRPERELEVIASVTSAQKEELADYLSRTAVGVIPQKTEDCLDIMVEVSAGHSTAKVRISGHHTNIILIEKDGTAVTGQNGYKLPQDSTAESACFRPDYGLLTVEDIYEFAGSADMTDVSDILERQIAYNTAIAEEGLRGSYGANIGSVLLASYGTDIKTRAKAMAAAGSDARMNGCELPVIINSGSGNQGLTVSLPVIVYAGELAAGREKLCRALLISNLTAIHLKAQIGRLSAYCGAVTAGAGAGAGIAYLMDGRYEFISHTIVNALAIPSGMICDGAKPSCAAKIAVAVDAGILGFEMYRNGRQFYAGEGVISKGVENTIHNIGRLGKDGMRDTDKEILNIMTGH